MVILTTGPAGNLSGHQTPCITRNDTLVSALSGLSLLSNYREKSYSFFMFLTLFQQITYILFYLKLRKSFSCFNFHYDSNCSFPIFLCSVSSNRLRMFFLLTFISLWTWSMAKPHNFSSPIIALSHVLSPRRDENDLWRQTLVTGSVNHKIPGDQRQMMLGQYLIPSKLDHVGDELSTVFRADLPDLATWRPEIARWRMNSMMDLKISPFLSSNLYVAQICPKDSRQLIYHVI
jgi:hypothetical protein